MARVTNTMSTETPEYSSLIGRIAIWTKWSSLLYWHGFWRQTRTARPIWSLAAAPAASKYWLKDVSACRWLWLISSA